MHRTFLRASGLLAILLAGAALVAVSVGSSVGAATPGLQAECGTGATVVGSDEAGKITMGEGVASCTLYFSEPWPNEPACVAVNETKSRPMDTRSTRTSVTMGIGVALDADDVVAYICKGY